MNMKLAVLPGDGIGAEVIEAAMRVLRHVAQKFGHTIDAQQGDIGWAALDKGHKTALPAATKELCARSDAIFFGAVGLPDRDKTLPLQERPERVALLELRKGLFANLRHVVLPKNLGHLCPLKPALIEKGIDIMIIRELTGGLYYGQPQGVTGSAPDRKAVDTMAYSEMEIRRILKVGFETARKRRKRLLSVDKANILATSQLWREVATAMAKEYADVQVEHMYVDNASMQLLRRPSEFDVIVTENTFGDILSDEASMLAGSIGLVPSACLGNEFLATYDLAAKGLPRATPFYEPIHGSAPDIAGKDLANPIATILTGSMMLRYTFGLQKEADAIDAATFAVLNEGKTLTGDLGGKAKCSEVAAAVIGKI
ncbi:MAG TPA: 3-isopropylmalate dehydrogenase [Phycisphaerae bacterium]|nr:3-isopropylmalate dehydrogenase [Phycisphaerae bacterium]